MREAGILVVDIGGNKIKLALEDPASRRKAPSGPELTPRQAVETILRLASDWTFDRVTIGCPGPVRNGRIVSEPVNLGPGWVGFDFEQALGRPTRLVNDAVMQAIGSHSGGRMLFLGLGTGLGTALVVDDVAMAFEVAHLPYRNKRSYEDWVGRRGLERLGRKRWERAVHDVVQRLRKAFVADEVVLGGGNAKRLQTLPEGVRLGGNALAFRGGVRIWREAIRVL